MTIRARIFESDRSRRILLLSLLLLVVTALYSTGLAGGFVIDDRTYFLDNDLLPGLKPWDLKHIFLLPSNYWGEMLPLRDFAYVVQYALFGKDPYGYHVVSLLLYLGVISACGYMLMSLAALNANRRPSSMVMVLPIAFFALHPVHVESVAYVSGQKDLLCALFSFLAIGFALQLLSGHAVKKPYFRLLSLVLCYYAAIWSKSLAVATALVLTFLLALYCLKNRTKWWVMALGWVTVNVPVLLWFQYSLEVAKPFLMQSTATVSLPVAERLIRGLRIIGEHIFLLVWPTQLNFGYPFFDQAAFDLAFWMGGMTVLLLLLLLVYCRNVAVRFAVLLMLCFLLPVSQIFRDLYNASIYDRYLFVPVLGCGVLLGESMAFFWHKRPMRPFLVGISLLLLGFLGVNAAAYIPSYRSDVAVARRAYRLYPEWNATSFNLAVALVEAGENDQARNLLASEPSLLQPAWVPGYLSGWMLLNEGDPVMAAQQLQQSFWLSVRGGYFPYPAVPFAQALHRIGEHKKALSVLDSVGNSRIANPLDSFRAKKLGEIIESDMRSRLSDG